eukprot:scaffold585055_cov34-Prasinocladus_malaysianus.AAC.1
MKRFPDLHAFSDAYYRTVPSGWAANTAAANNTSKARPPAATTARPAGPTQVDSNANNEVAKAEAQKELAALEE